MTLTSSDTVLVHKVHNTYAWLQILEGEDEGQRISVPLYSEQYSPELTADIRRYLNQNAIVNVTTERLADEPNNWLLTDITPTAITNVKR